MGCGVAYLSKLARPRRGPLKSVEMMPSMIPFRFVSASGPVRGNPLSTRMSWPATNGSPQL